MVAMMSKAQCATVAWVAVGRSSAATELSPVTWVLGLNPARMESSWGIFRPPLTLPSSWSRPNRYSGTWVSVSQTSSAAANLTGCWWKTCRAMLSPSTNCTGVRIAATVNGTVKPSRW